MADKEDAPFGYKKNGMPRKRAVANPTGKGGKHGKGKHKTTTGKGKSALVDQSTWRIKMRGDKVKFDDEAKVRYLEAMVDTGLKWASADAAGVSQQTVNDHRDIDPEFEAAVCEAIDSYRDKVITHHRKLLFEGEVHKTFDKEGNLIGEKHVYPIRLIELELKRQEPEYRDKQQIDLTASGGGVLVAPADKTPQEWIAEQRAANEAKMKTIEVVKK